MSDLTPYSTAAPFFGVPQSWIPVEDRERIQSYQLYESIYRNVPDAFKIVQRGSEQNPIYVPSGKTIVDAANRYLAKRWTFAVQPTLGSDAERAALNAMLQNLFIREEMWDKFATQKKFGLIRGDAVWLITANENKDPGKRISIHEVDPASYFPIYDPVNDTKVVGAHLVDQFLNDKGDTIVRRQTYRKDDATGRITYEVTWWEIGAWDDRENSGQELKRATPPLGFTAQPTFALPDIITAIPLYHIRNDRTANSVFGTSELAGMERLIAGINQAISDEELALVLEGLGLYATTSGPPTNEDGEETEWGIGPGYVVEIDAESEFKRVNGVGSITPMQDHIKYLEDKMFQSSGTPLIAIGKVDASRAESGIALMMEMSPLLAKNEEREGSLLSRMDHMLYDLVTMWLPAFEGTSTEARAVSIVDDPMPQNRKAVLDELLALLGAGAISIAYFQQQISEKLGFEFPEEMLADIVSEQARLAEARNRDPFMQRVVQELEA